MTPELHRAFNSEISRLGMPGVCVKQAEHESGWPLGGHVQIYKAHCVIATAGATEALQVAKASRNPDEFLEKIQLLGVRT